MRIVIAIPTIILNRRVHTDHADGYALMHWTAVRCDQKNPQDVRLDEVKFASFADFSLEPKTVVNLSSGTPLKKKSRSYQDELPFASLGSFVRCLAHRS
jgi:hypothetical protein